MEFVERDFSDNLESKLSFDFEADLRREDEKDPNFYTSEAEICKFFLKGSCAKGSNCPYKHIRGEKTVVCKHWLRSLCKKGDQCEFLHQYDLAKMPECFFFTQFGECSNPDCLYRHINPDDRIKECPWYARGFCKHGPACRHKHVRKIACESFLLGFCSDGPNCKFGHPKYELPKEDDRRLVAPKQIAPPTSGHQFGDRMPAGKRPLDQVTCFKCGQTGHYANKCPNRGYMFPVGQGEEGGGYNAAQPARGSAQQAGYMHTFSLQTYST